MSHTSSEFILTIEIDVHSYPYTPDKYSTHINEDEDEDEEEDDEYDSAPSSPPSPLPTRPKSRSKTSHPPSESPPHSKKQEGKGFPQPHSIILSLKSHHTKKPSKDVELLVHVENPNSIPYEV